jgi:gliding motility-associated protein GldM
MAGGKLSPRQKMINMMYLVLLALLAMNISKEVLDAFDVLSAELSYSATIANDSNVDFVDRMKEEIKGEIDNEGKKDNEGLLTDTLPMVRDMTSSVIDSINKHIAHMYVLGNQDSVTGKITKKDELDKNYKYWMGQTGDAQLENKNDFGPRGAGKAMALRDQIEAHTREMIKIYNANLRGEGADERKLDVNDFLLQDHIELTATGEPNPEYNESWEQHNFKGPVVANIAYLQALKSKVFAREKDLLNLLNERLGVATFKVDKVVPIDAPISTIVPAGLPFQTRLYVAMSSSQITPKFYSGSGRVKEEDGGNSATLTINASGANIPKGKNEGKQRYSATIQVPKATGGFENLPVQGEFTVRKPEVVITSASVQNLYRNCGNAINVDVPALGDYYNPKIGVSGGGSVTQSQESKKKFLVVPTGRRAVLNVSSLTNGQTVKIDDVAYNVIEPPKPTIEMRINGKLYNGTSPIPATSRIQVSVKADPEFKAALPRDARYSVDQIEVLAALSLGPPTRVESARGSSNMEAGVPVRLGTRVRQAGRGTKVFVRIDKIYRVNYKGQKIEDKRISELERTLSFVTR